jgi:DNA polymerase-3 subunit delta'
MFFKDVIGHKEVKHKLVEMVQHNRLSHALLFLGREGSGALPLALAFAQYLTCETVTVENRQWAMGNRHQATDNRQWAIDKRQLAKNSKKQTATDKLTQAGDEPCGICLSCIKAAQLIHPDIHYSYPVITKKSGTPPISTDFISEWREFVKLYPYGNIYDWLQFIGAENKQGNITANECSDIIRKLNLKSFESEYKIFLMWMPEYLGNEGNKLLKLIEEPPPNTLFIFLAENESQILPTIVSRCQMIKIPAIETDDIENALIERNNTGPEQARQIACISEGNYRQALQLVQHADEDWQSLLRDWISSVYRQNLVAQVKWVEEMSRQGREKQKQFLRYFNHLLEQAIRLKTMGPEHLSLPDNEKDFAERLNKIGDISQQQAIITEIDRASYYIERNANSKILFHALTIKLYHIIHDKIVFLTN